MKIYISGKISGLDRQETIDKFEEASEYLKHCTFEVSNPMEFCEYKDGKTWENYMIECVAELIKCDAIYMLNDWSQSKGARIEYAIAKEMGLKISFE